MTKIGILGGGAWGTALAATALRAGSAVTLWAREPDVVRAINERGENPLYLPGIALDRAMRAVSDPCDALAVDCLLLVVPAQYVRQTLDGIKGRLAASVPVVIAAKGIECGTGATMGEVVGACLPAQPIAVLSGPTFAAEVARGLPTAVTLAADDRALADRVIALLGTPSFRLYRGDDPVGAEIGGAVKNVLAIACGIVGGRSLGENARAALITRGLAEMTRLAVAKGGQARTLMGLSGLGDLTLTCSAMQSRNFSLGFALGQGGRLHEILAGRQSVAEGVASAAAVNALAAKLGIDMPIVAAVQGILFENAGIDETIATLLARPFRAELV